jgi:hypothetical protein
MLTASQKRTDTGYDFGALEAAFSARLAEVERIPDLRERFEEARALRAEIAEGQCVFRTMGREAIVELKASGLSWRQIGQLLGMSGARAEQISKAA